MRDMNRRAAKSRHPSDYTGRLKVTEQLIPVNANVSAAIRFHKEAQRAVELEELKNLSKMHDGRLTRKDEEPFDKLCAIERNALSALVHATPRNLKEAAARLIYLEKYWRTVGDGDGELAWPMLSMCIQSLEYHAA
jgi:hypothetical protein